MTERRERTLAALKANAEVDREFQFDREFQQADPPIGVFLLFCIAVGFVGGIAVWATIWHQWVWQVIR